MSQQRLVRAPCIQIECTSHGQSPMMPSRVLLRSSFAYFEEAQSSTNQTRLDHKTSKPVWVSALSDFFCVRVGNSAIRENHCPLKNFRARMAETGELSEAELDVIDAEVMAEIEQSVTDAKAAARPTAEQVTEDVYIQYTATA